MFVQYRLWQRLFSAHAPACLTPRSPLPHWPSWVPQAWARRSCARRWLSTCSIRRRPWWVVVRVYWFSGLQGYYFRLFVFEKVELWQQVICFHVCICHVPIDVIAFLRCIGAHRHERVHGVALGLQTRGSPARWVCILMYGDMRHISTKYLYVGLVSLLILCYIHQSHVSS